MDAPDDWEADVLLADGGTMHLRPIRPDDGPLLVAFHERQSAESIYYRYFSPRPVLSEADVERLTTVDHVDRVAFVGLIGADLVGVARYDRYPTTEIAEVAFFTDEEQRGRGVATILLEFLAAAAREAGLSGFVAQVLPENRRMLSVFARAGFEVHSAFTDGIIEVELGIEPTDEARRLVSERAQVAYATSVRRLLAPEVIAVIGASRDPEAIGHRVLAGLVDNGFTGKVIPVNPHGGTVGGLRAIPSVIESVDDIDIAVICVPRAAVAGVVADCARRHVHGLVIITAGFSDSGRTGATIEQGIVAMARRSGMRVLGPNSMGMINTDPAIAMQATFVPVTPRRGRIGVSSQSGTLGAAIIQHAARRGLGISTFVSLGNQSDVTNSDMLGYWEDDDATDQVLLYLESFGDPSGFARSTRRLARKKPVIAVKSGGTLPLGPSETGLPASVDVEALLAQIGLIRVDTLTELLDVATVLERQPIPRGPRLAILSNARSPAVLAVDAARGSDLEIAEVRIAGHDNPIDLGFDVTPEAFGDVLAQLCQSPKVDAVAVVCTPVLPDMIDAFDAQIVAAAQGSQIPVVATYLGLEPRAVSAGSTVPVFAFPESAVRAIGRAARHGEWLRRDPGELPDADLVDGGTLGEVLDGHATDRPEWLDHTAAAQVLAAAGATLVERRFVSSPAEAVAAAEEIGWPVALKAAGVARPAKTEAGGVAVDVHGASELEAAYGRMSELLGSAMDHGVVQEMTESGVDVRIGLVRSDLVGAVLTLEVDRAFVTTRLPAAVQVVPCSDTDARAMVESSGLAEALRSGETGGLGAADAAVAVDRVVELLQRLSVLAEHVPRVAAVVADPVIVSRRGAVLTDVRVRVEPPSPQGGLRVRRLDGGTDRP